MKEITISDGNKILTSDLEEKLLNHPDITAAAVIGVPDKYGGENPVAFVEVWGPVSFNTGSARKWVNARLSQREQIHEIHVVEKLPRNSMGEVLVRELRDQLV